MSQYAQCYPVHVTKGTPNVTIPDGVIVQRYPARVAKGAHMRAIAPRGDGCSFYGTARSTADTAAQNDRRAILARAALRMRR